MIATTLVTIARIACPLAFGLMALWLMREAMRDPNTSQSPAKRLDALRKQREKLESELRQAQPKTRAGEME